MADGTLTFDTSVDTSNFESELSNVDSRASTLRSTFSTLATTIASAFVVDKVKDFITESVNAAAEAQALNAQFDQVFGDLGSQAEDAITAMSEEFNMLPNRIKPSFTSTTSMFKGLGLSTEDAMDQATIAVTAASDAAAFYDKSYEDANSALNSFIKGNYEGGESIGLFASETTLAAWASENLGVTWDNLTEADKQIARLSYATSMQEASGATGQAAREGNSYSNELGNLSQAFTDLSATAGQVFLPIATTIIGYLTDFVTWGQQHPTLIKGIAIALGVFATALTVLSVATSIATMMNVAFGVATTACLAPILLVMAGIIALIAVIVLIATHWEQVKAIAVAVWDAIVAAAQTAWALIQSAWGGVTSFFSGIWNGIKSAFSSVASWFSSTFSAAWTAVKNVFSTGGKIFDGIKDGIASVFTTTVNAIIGGINKVISVPFNALNTVLKSIKSVSIAGIKPFSFIDTLSVPQIPKLATGTVVPANYGEFQAILGDNKREPEVVSPLSTIRQAVKEAMGSGGTGTAQINVYLGSKLILQEMADLNALNTLKTGVNALA